MNNNLFFADVEALGMSPVNGVMTEFGVVHGLTKKTFHGRLYEGTPDPQNPAVPIVGKKINEDNIVGGQLIEWMKSINGNDRNIMVSDNPAYDFMWIAGMYDRAGIANPFGHSARRISDFWAGINRKWSDTQSWKRFRRTPHDHNPVNDAMGNVEAMEVILRKAKELRVDNTLMVGGKKVEFSHTSVNKAMHLWIDDYHYRDVCPECIQKGILVEK